jgi:hypothetical protein
MLKELVSPPKPFSVHVAPLERTPVTRRVWTVMDIVNVARNVTLPSERFFVEATRYWADVMVLNVSFKLVERFESPFQTAPLHRALVAGQPLLGNYLPLPIFTKPHVLGWGLTPCLTPSAR